MSAPSIRCIQCRHGAVAEDDRGSMRCDHCGTCYLKSHGRPVLIRSDNPLFSPDRYLAIDEADRPARGLQRLVPNASVNLAFQRTVTRLRSLLPSDRQSTVLVVGGGRQRCILDPLLGTGDAIRTIYVDIDVNADVDFFADAHDLPLFDGSVDAVVTTAVLEHVIDPERVAAEIGRVTKTGGLLYSELPFMQQVHEGAYDFTRYTASGHLRLFRDFDALECGLVAGPATALSWALEHLFLTFVTGRRSRLFVKAATRWSFGWIRYLDYLLRNRPAALDGASSTYLLGRRRTEPRADHEIVASYAGAQSLSHG